MSQSLPSASSPVAAPAAARAPAPALLGEDVLAMQLAHLGVRHVFGVVGIPVVGFSHACQRAGISFFSFRNEQSASYAAATYGYLTGRPGVCLCVSGPGVVHALAGLANAQVNAWPMLLLGGSHRLSDTHRGAFQEAPATHGAMVAPYVKFAACPVDLEHAAYCFTKAHAAAVGGRPGPVYIELSETLLTLPVAHNTNSSDNSSATHKSINHDVSTFALDKSVYDSFILPAPWSPRPVRLLPAPANPAAVTAAAAALTRARRPLLYLGKGAAASASAPAAALALCSRFGIPFLAAPMAKGVIDDDHALCAGAARSRALAQADVVVLAGARAGWMLRHGKGLAAKGPLTVIQIDVSGEEVGSVGLVAPQPRFGTASGSAAAVNGPCALSDAIALQGDVGLVLGQLDRELSKPQDAAVTASAAGVSADREQWVRALLKLAAASKAKLDAKIARDILASTPTTQQSQSQSQPLGAAQARQPQSHSPPPALERAALMSYHAALGTLQPLIPPTATLVTEGANTMDNARLILPSHRPRHRLDAGAFATMGPSIGAVLAAFVARSEPDTESASAVPLVVGVFGDSSFGFAAMDVETLARYRVPAVLFVINNNGIYSGSDTIANGLAEEAHDARAQLTVTTCANNNNNRDRDSDSAGGCDGRSGVAGSISPYHPHNSAVSALPHSHSAHGHSAHSHSAHSCSPSASGPGAPVAASLPTTALTPHLRYDALAVALGAHPTLSCTVTTPAALAAAAQRAFEAVAEHNNSISNSNNASVLLPVVINVIITPEGAGAAKLKSTDAFFGGSGKATATATAAAAAAAAESVGNTIKTTLTAAL
mgnify:CR=1 FL=1